MINQWKIKCFAGLVQKLGTKQLQLDLPQSQYTAGEFKQLLCTLYPDHELTLKHCFIAANMQYRQDEQLITNDQELAILPPVSGGQNELPINNENEQSTKQKFVITANPISTEEVMNKVITPSCGATLLFVGTTREFTEGQRTVFLEYEAYEPMAISTLEQIGAEITERWPGADCAITHRIGKVELAEISVVIAVATPHRQDCYEASRYAIERLKQIVPIWKKEIWEDGSEWKGHQLGPWNPTTPTNVS